MGPSRLTLSLENRYRYNGVLDDFITFLEMSYNVYIHNMHFPDDAEPRFLFFSQMAETLAGKRF